MTVRVSDASMMPVFSGSPDYSSGATVTAIPLIDSEIGIWQASRDLVSS